MLAAGTIYLARAAGTPEVAAEALGEHPGVIARKVGTVTAEAATRPSP